MIARLKGILESVGVDRVLLTVGDVGYEVLVPGADIDRLSRQIGREVTFFTINYLEGSSAGGQLTPRLIGFIRNDDKAFFELFITVDGLGPRKALRAMTMPVGRLASAVEGSQGGLLSKLPGIGKRTADKIIAALKGKLERFATGEEIEQAKAPARAFETEALAALVQLGERRPEAELWVRKALQRSPDIESAEALIAEVYRVKNL